MAGRIGEFRELGVDVAAVSMSKPSSLALYLASNSLPLPIFADPERKAYSAFALGRSTWGQIIRPGVMWRFMKHVVRGAKIRLVPEGEDALQTGGDFLINPNLQLLWAFRSNDPTRRPSVDELVHAARTR